MVLQNGRHVRVAALVVLFTAVAALAYAQKTDVVTLRNGDRITGEIKQLDRGRLEFSTDDEGTIYFEWDKIVSVQANRQFEVGTSDGRRFLGSLATDGPRMLVVIGAADRTTLSTNDVTLIDPIGRSFWAKLDGSVDIGFSYTKSSNITQLNANSTTTYRQPRSEVRVSGSATLTNTGEDDEADDRAIGQVSYLHYRGTNLYGAAAGSVESNESLGLLLRTLGAFALGRRLVYTNRAQITAGGGIAVNDERAVDSDPSQNIEGLLTFRASYYSYDTPKTNIDVGFQYYPSFSDWGRQRIQLDSAFKREFWKDVFFSVNVFDTFDSRPPTVDAEHNDVGVVLSFGWTY
jgi:hypothetical protein